MFCSCCCCSYLFVLLHWLKYNICATFLYSKNEKWIEIKINLQQISNEHFHVCYLAIQKDEREEKVHPSNFTYLFSVTCNRAYIHNKQKKVETTRIIEETRNSNSTNKIGTRKKTIKVNIVYWWCGHKIQEYRTISKSKVITSSNKIYYIVLVLFHIQYFVMLVVSKKGRKIHWHVNRSMFYLFLHICRWSFDWE